MSAGTTQLCDQEMIRKVVAKLIQQGQTIVAARSNDAGRYTVPACCAGVLGAAADPALVGGQVYVRDAVFCFVPPRPLRLSTGESGNRCFQQLCGPNGHCKGPCSAFQRLEARTGTVLCFGRRAGFHSKDEAGLPFISTRLCSKQPSRNAGTPGISYVGGIFERTRIFSGSGTGNAGGGRTAAASSKQRTILERTLSVLKRALWHRLCV